MNASRRHPDSLIPLLSLRFKPLYQAVRKEALPFWFLCAYLLIEYLRPQDMYYQLNVGPLGEISILLCFGGVILSGSKPLRFGPIDGLFIAFTSILILSGFQAWNPDYSWANRNTFLSWIILYFAVVSLITTPKRALLFWLFFFLINFKMSQFGTRTFITRGFSFAHWGVAGAPGWFHNSGELSLEMVVLFSMSAALLLAHRRFVSQTWWRILVVLIPGTALVTVIASSSRGSQLAFLAVGLILLVWMGMKARTLLLVLAGFALAFFLLPQEQRQRFSEMGEDRTSVLRLEYWGHAREIAKDNLTFGIGYWNWVPYYRANYNPRGEEVHNSVLQAFVELGFPGGVVFLTLFITALFTNHQTFRRFARAGPGGESMAGMAFGLNLSLVGIFIAGFFMSVLYYPMFWLAFALTAALRNQAVALPKTKRRRVPVRRPVAQKTPELV